MIRAIDKEEFLQKMQGMYSAAVQRMATGLGIRLMGCFNDTGEGIGYAIWYLNGVNACIYMIKVKDEEPKLVQALIDETIKVAKSLGVKHMSWETIWHTRPEGFKYSVMYRLYAYQQDENGDWGPIIRKFRDKTKPLAERIASMGYVTLPLSQATPAQITEMKELYRVVNPEYDYIEEVLDGMRMKLPDALNFFTLWEGKVVAYLLACVIGKKHVILKYRYSHPDHKGAMMISFFNFVQAIYDSDYQSVRIQVNDTNTDSIQMFKKHMKGLEPVMYILNYAGDI